MKPECENDTLQNDCLQQVIPQNSKDVTRFRRENAGGQDR